jgi:hypothetical protein
MGFFLLFCMDECLHRASLSLLGRFVRAASGVFLSDFAAVFALYQDVYADAETLVNRMKSDRFSLGAQCAMGFQRACEHAC